MHPNVFTEVALPLKSLAARRLIVPSDFKSRDRSLCIPKIGSMGMNMKQTAMPAGYPPSTANTAGIRIEPRHQARLKARWNKSGVTN